GYLVINQAEALVAIDVNSGKSTKERNIEATALKTNMEAAEESARQMRLRDLAGLIVIDFIDMDESKNNRSVEKKLKDALAEDRARIQMGKISGFGLMEISRQRRRTGFLEGTTIVCPHCEGQGRIRSIDSAALSAMRAIDMEAMQNGAGAITVKVPMDVALYILNEKQVHLSKLRLEWGLKVNIEIDTDLGHTEVQITRTVHADEVDFVAPVRPEPIAFDTTPDVAEEEDEDEEAIEAEDSDDDDGEKRAERSERPEREDREGGRNGKRRRRRRGGRDRFETEERPAVDAADADESDDEDAGPEGESDEARKGRRRRGRRGGRRAGFDSRPRETYSWVRARTPSLEAPYVWIDPFEEQQKRFDQPARSTDASRDALKEAASPQAAISDSVTSALGAVTTQPTSLVPEGTQSSGSRRQRPPRRRRGGVDAVEPVEGNTSEALITAPMPTSPDVDSGVAPELISETGPASSPVEAEITAPVRKTRSRKKVVESAEAMPAETAPAEAVAAPVKAPRPSRAKVAKTVPEPVLASPAVTETIAVAPPEPQVVLEVVADPNEISAPPEKPKRGWWRR
ncbi:MAG TPA: ribonuclease E/G, partial [Asticcacaulis sp.]|nr:ribonuclease E/G [Asticcacaulis sp.]